MPATLPHSNTTTSLQAARHAVDKSTADRRALCEFVQRQGARGATDEEIAQGCPLINANAIRARRGECAVRLFITKAMGERRATASGNAAQVWHVTALGCAAVGAVGAWSVPMSALPA